MRPDPAVPDLTAANRAESLRRRLEDLEDAYGPVIRQARKTPGCTDIAVNEDGRIWTTTGGAAAPAGSGLTEHAARRIVNLVSDIDQHPIEKAALSANLPTGERFAALLRSYGAAVIGEIGDSERSLELLEEYTGVAGRMQMSYVFDFLSGNDLAAARISEVFDSLHAVAPNSWPCWAMSNHDVVRHISRWNLTDQAAKAYATVLLCLKGSVCLYQGEELGLPEADIAFEDLQDPYGKEFWPEFKGRDGSRTPMPWIAGAEHAGFTRGGKPWLPVTEAHRALAADRQEMRPDSTLNVWRRCLALRRLHPELKQGGAGQVDEDGPVLSFTRGDRLVAVFNLSCGRADHVLPAGRYSAIEIPLPGPAALLDGSPQDGMRVGLPPLGAFLALRDG